MTHADRSWVVRTDVLLKPDHGRVVTRLFLPGQEMAALGESRSPNVLERVLALSDAEVSEALAAVTADFAGRHADLDAQWDRHSQLVKHRLVDTATMSVARRRLIGAYFTQEYAIEGAAFFNPSMVAHPDQTLLPVGATRFLMTVRAVGEGHISAIEVRTGVVGANNEVLFDLHPTTAVLGTVSSPQYRRADVENQLSDLGRLTANAQWILDQLPESFSRSEIMAGLDGLREQRLTRGAAVETLKRFETVMANSYLVEFPASSTVQERVLLPSGPAESQGMEDARVVRLTDKDRPAEYLATYTAYDGRRVASQLFLTNDFRTFEVAALSGPGARNKGLAIFPRRIGDKYFALSRADRESNAIANSDDLRHWTTPNVVQSPEAPWEIVQLGNCGPPIETSQGWLVLTHGVGPMRKYSIGAILLDLDDPSVIIGRLREPLLSPTDDERSGYVPNVVYSCGAMLHGETLVLPYGCSDAEVRVALVDVGALLSELTAPASSPEAQALVSATR